MKKWNILFPKKQNGKKQFSDTEILSILIKNRGINTKKETERYLNPSLESISISDAGLRKVSIDKAVKRIIKAKKNSESVVVCSDYDVDGLTGGAIIWETLYEEGVKIMPYIPHRIREGYGLSKTGIDNIIKMHHPSLMITVDHGINAVSLVEYAKKNGIETIIIDHHQKPKALPEAFAIVHTTKLSAGAICWLFSACYKTRIKNIKFQKLLYENLDLAALSTIADMIPLTGINRIIVKYGLEELNKTKRIGLQALIKEASLIFGKIGVREVGRIIGPRINALGRLSHAMDALRLLCTKDFQRAANLARLIGSVNRERQVITQESLRLAINLARKENNYYINIVSHSTFQQGVIGLIAGRLAEGFNKPAIVISEGGKYSKGSVRSVKGLNILAIIKKHQGLLTDFGGHPMAAGFTILTENIAIFKRQLCEQISNENIQEKYSDSIDVDMELDLDFINEKLHASIQKLEPFGIGNPEPVFLCRNQKAVRVKLVGKNNDHLKITISQNPKMCYSTFLDHDRGFIEAVGFGLGSLYQDLINGKKFDFIYTIENNLWNGRAMLQLVIKDVKLTS